MDKNKAAFLRNKLRAAQKELTEQLLPGNEAVMDEDDLERGLDAIDKAAAFLDSYFHAASEREKTINSER